MATGSERLKREPSLEELGNEESNKRAKHESSREHERLVLSVPDLPDYIIELGKKDAVVAALRKENRRASPLLKLPGELRNQIYSYFPLFRSSSDVMCTSEYRRLAHVSRQLREEVHSYTRAYGMFYIDCGDVYDDSSCFCQFEEAKKNRVRCVMVDIAKLRYNIEDELTYYVTNIVDFIQPLYEEGILQQIIVRAAQDVELFRRIRHGWKDVFFQNEAFKVLKRTFGEDVIREEDADWYPEEPEYEGEETDTEENEEAEDAKMEIDWAADWDSDEEDSDWDLENETEDGIDE